MKVKQYQKIHRVTATIAVIEQELGDELEQLIKKLSDKPLPPEKVRELGARLVEASCDLGAVKMVKSALGRL